MNTIFPLSVALALLAQGTSAHALSKRHIDIRQDCPSGYDTCGAGCIPLSYTCCADQAGGCPSDEYCSLGDDGEYGCCPDGEICSGDGGAFTSDLDYTVTSTYDTYEPATATGADYPLSWDTLTITFSDDTTTISWALYEGGYVTNSDDLDWETTTYTFDDGDKTTATYASYPEDDIATSSARRTSTTSDDSTLSTTTRARTTGATGQSTVTETASAMASHVRRTLFLSTTSWLCSSTVLAGTVFIAMVLL